MRVYRAIDVPAGAGGLSIGLQRAGFDVLGVEINPDACATHRANVGPCVEADMDLWHPEAPADLVAGGPPCQSFSAIGEREGMNDARGQHFHHLVRIAVEARASALLLENVTGLLSWRDDTRHGMAFHIAEAYRAAGYDCRYQVLNAADFGVPQSRERVFFVGFRDKTMARAFRWPDATHGTPGGMFLPPWRTVREVTGYPYDALAPTVTATEHKSAMNFGSRGAATNPRHAFERMTVADRTLTERPTVEQWALMQGFPAGMIFTGDKAEQHRQVGNAAPPAFGEALGGAILKAIRSVE